MLVTTQKFIDVIYLFAFISLDTISNSHQVTIAINDKSSRTSTCNYLYNREFKVNKRLARPGQNYIYDFRLSYYSRTYLIPARHLKDRKRSNRASLS